MLFDELEKAASGLCEDNDCSVKAVAAATGTHYVDVHSLMASRGREPRKCTNTTITLEVLEQLGFQTEDVTKFYKSKTIRTLGREMKYRQGSHLVWTSSGHHILAVVDGVVCDWTKDRTHRVHRIDRVTRKSVA